MAPFDKQLTEEVRHCFDRRTRIPVSPELLPTYRQALAQYHLNPEDKFLNGDYTDSGVTLRRHIEVSEIEHIGKESERWEEQFFVGSVFEAGLVFGEESEAARLKVNEIVRAAGQFGSRRLARASDLSVGEISMVLRGLRRPSPETVMKLELGVERLCTERLE